MTRKHSVLFTSALMASAIALTTSTILQGAPQEKAIGTKKLYFGGKPIRITLKDQPADQSVPLGGTASFQVSAKPKPATKDVVLSYQWLRNCQVLPGETNSTLIVQDVTTNSVGFYTCAVTANESLTLTQPALLIAYTTNLVGPITVWSTPPPYPGGISGTCPGAYVGYINYKKTNAPYGWTIISGVPHSARDTTRSDTAIKWFGNVFPESGCGLGGFVNVSPVKSTVCRFTLYFPTYPVPSTPYPLQLDGFNP